MIESICYFRSSNEGRRVSFVKEKRKKENIRSTLETRWKTREWYFSKRWRAREKEVEGGFKRYSHRSSEGTLLFFLRNLSGLGFSFFRLP